MREILLADPFETVTDLFFLLIFQGCLSRKSSCMDLVTLYRCRWEVETLFRELKSQYKLDDFDTSNLDVVETLLYAALLSLLVDRDLLELVTKQADDEIVFLPECWAATFRSYAQLILHELGECLDYSPPPLLEGPSRRYTEDP